jgi:hypothetical protein
MLLCDEAVLVEGKKGGGSVQEIELRLLSFDQYEDLRKTFVESKDTNGAKIVFRSMNCRTYEYTLPPD